MKSLTFPYGVGFRSLESETRAPVPLRVEGALPPWLQGTLIRTGPSKFEVGDRTYNHWFDGLAMLHRFAFANGAVTYMSRFLEGDAFRSAWLRLVSGLAGRSGLETGAVSFAGARERRIDAIADALEEHIDLDAVLRLVEDGAPLNLPPVRGGLVT